MDEESGIDNVIHVMIYNVIRLKRVPFLRMLYSIPPINGQIHYKSFISIEKLPSVSMSGFGGSAIDIIFSI